MASPEAVAAVVGAGGAHVPGLMGDLEQRLAAIAQSHGPTLGEYAGATIAAGGKRLRPLLVFVAAGPDPAGRDAALRAALAVELVHSATLVHDDVLDPAGPPRGRPPVVAPPGPPPAAATARLLFSPALAPLARGGAAARTSHGRGLRGPLDRDRDRRSAVLARLRRTCGRGSGRAGAGVV